MDDALFVRRFERVGDLRGDRQRVAEGHRSAGNDRREVVAVHQLHDQRHRFDAVNGRDVGMIERRQHLRLARETRQSIGVVGKQRGQHFEGDVSIECGIACAIHLAHTSLSEQAEDLVRAKTIAGLKTHLCGDEPFSFSGAGRGR